jgi:hypothetical protein
LNAGAPSAAPAIDTLFEDRRHCLRRQRLAGIGGPVRGLAGPQFLDVDPIGVGENAGIAPVPAVEIFASQIDGGRHAFQDVTQPIDIGPTGLGVG